MRDTHLEALAEAKLEEFKARAAAHLRATFPETSEALRAEGLREAVELGLERARSYTIESERGIVGYLELMFRCGRDFDRDPELPFAARILQERKVFEREPSLARLLEVEERIDEALRDADALGYARRPGGEA